MQTILRWLHAPYALVATRFSGSAGTSACAAINTLNYKHTYRNKGANVVFGLVKAEGQRLHLSFSVPHLGKREVAMLTVLPKRRRACDSLLSRWLIKLDTDLDKGTQVIDSKCYRCIENPRVGGSIPPLGTTFTNKNNDLRLSLPSRVSPAILRHS